MKKFEKRSLDERTKNYFQAIKNNLEYIGTNHGHHGIEDILKENNISGTLIKKHKGFVNSSDIDIYKYEKEGQTRYCAELSYQTAIDDYNIETIIFRKYPTLQNIIDIREIESLEFKFKYDRLDPEFTCWECGRTYHWLDIPGSFKEKLEAFQEKYCGC